MYQLPLADWKSRPIAREDLATFWDQYKRLLNPHRYKVDLSDELWMLKQSMLKHGVETVQAQK